MRPKTLDHVALWVADRDPITDFVTERLGDARDRADRQVHARRLERAPRQADAVRCRGSARAGGAQARRAARERPGRRARRASKASTSARENGGAYFDVAEGLRLGLVEADDRGRLRPRPRRALLREPRGDGSRVRASSASRRPRAADARVEVGGAFVEFHPGEPGDPERPLLNHLAVLVDSADEHLAEAKRARDRGRRRRRRGEHLRGLRLGPGARARSSTSSTSRRSRSNSRPRSLPGPAWPVWPRRRARASSAPRRVVLEKGDRAGGSMLLSSGVDLALPVARRASGPSAPAAIPSSSERSWSSSTRRSSGSSRSARRCSSARPAIRARSGMRFDTRGLTDALVRAVGDDPFAFWSAV